MEIEFTAPDFIAENSPEEIEKRMLKRLPDDMDKMPGGFPYDFTMPTALEKAELIEFHLVQTLMLMFPMWAWGEWLDYHAAAAGLVRRAAGYAAGYVTVRGQAETKIPAGTIFAAPAVEEAPAVEFKTGEDTQVGPEGEVKIFVTAVEAGTGSNVPAGTVTIQFKPMPGILSVINEEEITGGTQEEDDGSLRERIQEANEAKGTSFVGNDSDYRRWAKEITGVGDVIVIPEWDGPGTVKLVLTDANGAPANNAILEEVRTHILSPENPMERKAPIGAVLTVTAPEMTELVYSAVLSAVPGVSMEDITEGFRAGLSRYYAEARKEGILRYTRLASVLSGTVGVQDYSDFTVNGKKENITLLPEQFPETAAVELRFRQEGETLG